MKNLKEAARESKMSVKTYKDTLMKKYPGVPLYMIVGTGTRKNYPVLEAKNDKVHE